MWVIAGEGERGEWQMIFETLFDSSKRGELLLIAGGFCHWHLRRDGQLTIREILVNTEAQGQGIGTRILEELRHKPGATSLFARCPADLTANGFYRKKGFVLEGTETTPRGRRLNLWRLYLR